MDKVAKQYLDEIQKWLPDGIENRNQFLSDMETAVESYIEENAETSYLSLTRQFGDPREITDDFLAEQDPRALIKPRRTLFLLVCLLVMVGVLVLFLWNAHKDLIRQVPTYQYESICCAEIPLPGTVN